MFRESSSTFNRHAFDHTPADRHIASTVVSFEYGRLATSEKPVFARVKQSARDRSRFSAMAMMVLMCLSLLSALALTPTAEAQGSQRWISEDLEADVRTGRTLQNRIIRMARSGESVSVLEEVEGYSRVRFSNGTEGWMLSRYLQNQPHSRDRLAAVQAELDEIRGGSDDQASRVAELLDTRRKMETEIAQLQASLGAQTEELEELRRLAARPAEIQRQNVELRESLTRTENELTDLRRELEISGAEHQRKWFTLGAFVVIGSLLLGAILSRLPARRRRDSW
ncbi:MAG: TIGR04211 family SH3 domain-containing protein [Thioalkalivibrionaceae bacterium]